MASQDARLSKFEANFKRQQVFSARSYLTQDSQCSNHVYGSINAITIHPKQPEGSQVNRLDEGQEEEGNLGNTSSNPHPQPDMLASIATEQVRNLNSMLESLRLVPQSSNTKFVCSKEDDGVIMFIEIIRDDDVPQNEGPNKREGATTEGPAVEYFDTFPTRDELTYHKKSVYLRNEEDKIRGVEYVMSKILGFYKECLELGPEYLTGMDDEGEVM
ncbi:hypothetical protein Tco_1314155 [Tanacetum coccineum]